MRVRRPVRRAGAGRHGGRARSTCGRSSALGFTPPGTVRMPVLWMLGQREAGDRPNVYAKSAFDDEQRAAIADTRRAAVRPALRRPRVPVARVRAPPRPPCRPGEGDRRSIAEERVWPDWQNRGTWPSPPPVPSMPFEVGQVVDHYRVDHVVHTGRFTVVYAATDVTLGRKTVEGAGRRSTRRSQLPRPVRPRGAGGREPRRPSEHGHRLRVGRGQTARSFLATQFVEGVTLEELLRQQPGGEPLPPDEALEYLRQIAAGARLRPQPPDRAPRREARQRAGEPRSTALTPRTWSTSASPRTSPTTPSRRTTGCSSGTAEYASPEQISGAEIDGAPTSTRWRARRSSC